MKLEDPSAGSNFSHLTFHNSGSYLLWRYTFKPLPLDHMLQVQQGAKGYNLDEYDECCVSLIHCASKPFRTVVLRLETEGQKKELYSGLRKLLTEVTMMSAPVPKPVAHSELTSQSPNRERLKSTPPLVPASAPKSPSPRNMNSRSSEIFDLQKKVKDLEEALDEERAKHGSVMTQLMEITNDFNAREDEVRALQRTLDSVVEEREILSKMHTENAQVYSIQNKRMESLQFDYEELQEENAYLKSKLQYLVNTSPAEDSPSAGSASVDGRIVLDTPKGHTPRGPREIEAIETGEDVEPSAGGLGGLGFRPRTPTGEPLGSEDSPIVVDGGHVRSFIEGSYYDNDPDPSP